LDCSAESAVGGQEILRRDGVLISRSKAFNREVREGFAKVAKKANRNSDNTCGGTVLPGQLSEAYTRAGCGKTSPDNKEVR